MRIEKGIETIGTCLYKKDDGILILSDIHLGYEEALNKQGILIPRFQFQDTINMLEPLLKKLLPSIIVVNGDIKHEFGKISNTEWRYITEFFRLLEAWCKKIIIVKGNHDVLLGPIARKKNIAVVEYYLVRDILICHGDKILKNKDFEKAKIVVIGHEHPAISFRDKERVETYKCFLRGTYKDKIVIAMPAFHTLTLGTDVRKETLLSPFLKDIAHFEVFVVDKKETVYFGKLGNL